MKKKKSGKTPYKNKHTQLAEGVLDVTRAGIGYVVVENQEKDIFIRPQDFNHALHGDRVRVRITRHNPRTNKMEGEVAEIIERKQTEFIGRIELNNGFGFFIPDKAKGTPDMYIPGDKTNGAKNGDRVVVKITSWDKKDKSPKGEVVSILNASDENDMAMKEILLDAGFSLEFEDDALEQAARIPDIIPLQEINRRRDMRDTLTFTIDPIDAKDFDDALSLREIKNGLYEIGVHIADVSHYVEPDTVLDTNAYNRATSVYLPDRVLPMLPEHISNYLCSLRPNEDKLTFSAIFQITTRGEIKNTWLGRTVIHSNHRFTYEDAQEVIEKGTGSYVKEILLLNNLAQKFRKKRFEKGAINFSSQEVRFKLDENGKPVGIIVKESKESHQLIEEFMLLANKAVAEHVSKVKIDKHPLPFPYRVHDQPDEEKLLPFVSFAKKFGHKFDVKTPESIARSFNAMLSEVQGKPEQHVLEQLGIRTMAKALYTQDNIGHYGLGFENYCHFTSPIRRYPDVLVHRILQQVLDGNPKPDKKMNKKCFHCSERERAAMEAERAANKYKQVEYMQNYLGEEFEGIISGVASFGFWVETIEQKCEGLVSVNNLLDYDDFRLVEEDYCLVGRRSGKKFRMGDKIRIKVIAANLGKRQLDYEWVIQAEEENKKPAKKSDGKRKK
ncbi:MAG: ribonuclease R [Chitinophagaceae bacterium]|nr:ribonuclease R [Chitinophagaceae bacterium]MCW5927984.1 ribonuclease R [Chitinophagaceae bacterium]